MKVIWRLYNFEYVHKNDLLNPDEKKGYIFIEESKKWLKYYGFEAHFFLYNPCFQGFYRHDLFIMAVRQERELMLMGSG